MTVVQIIDEDNIVAIEEVPTPITVTTSVGGGSGSALGDALTQSIAQTAHGFAVGDLVRYNGTAYVKGQADSAANAEVIGIVSAVANANNFTLLTDGKLTGLSGLTAGSVYFLSPSTAGARTVTEPTTIGQVSKPVLLSVSTTVGLFLNLRGIVIGVDVATQAELDAHVNDTTAAHTATAVSFSPAGTIAASTVQAAIEEVASEAGGGVSGLIDVREGYGTTSTAIQAAIDYAQTLVNGNGSGAPILWMAPGDYRWTTEVTMKSASIVGSGPNTGCVIYWDGSAGETMLTKDTSYSGGNSFGEISGICFNDGTAIPGTFIDLPTLGVDANFRLSELQFAGCSADAIKIKEWVNLHWEHLRFDSIGGFAIRATPENWINLSSFVIDGFTYDHTGAGTGGTGVLMIDSTAGASNVGPVKLCNGRVEMGTAWVGNKAFVEIKGDGASCPVALHLSDLSLSGTGSGNSILYSNSANANMSHALMMTNVVATGFDNVCGGTWWSGLTLPDMAGQWSYFGFNPNSGAPFSVGNALVHQGEGSPESAKSAPVGSLYVDVVNGKLYVKATGTGNTGWVVAGTQT